MQNRFFAGSARALLLVAAIIGLILLPAASASGAPINSSSPGATSKASQSHGVGALADDTAEPMALFPRTNYQWPFRFGPVYGLQQESTSSEYQPGIVRTQVGTFDLRLGTPSDLPVELRSTVNVEAAGAQYFVLVPNPEQMKGAGFDQYRDAIVSAGGAFVQDFGGGAYVVRLNAAALLAAQGRSGALVLEPFHPAFKLSPTIGRSPLFNEQDAVSDVYKLKVSVFAGESTAAVAQAIRALGGNVTRVDPISVEAEIHRSKLGDVAGIGAVKNVEENLPIVPWGEESASVMQSGAFHNGNGMPYNAQKINGGGKVGTCTPSGRACQSILDCLSALTTPVGNDTACTGGGPAQILMTVDTGIQLDDADLSDTRTSAGIPGALHRKVRVYETANQFGGNGDLLGCDDPTQGGFTHGHVVAATALGNATAVPLRYGAGYLKTDINNVVRPVDGVAPRAVLVTYDAHVTPLSGSCGDPTNNGLLPGTIYSGEGLVGSLEVAYHTHGARTFNFSWGTTNNPSYGANASAVDSFLQNHLDAMLFFGVGNDGKDVDGDNVPDPFSVSEPATAKNAVTVGASGNTSEPFNGANEQDRNATSGVGPATNASQRIAPLLMAPGVDFGTVGANMGFDSEYACRSNDNDQANGVECDVSQGFTGTSVSSSAAAGAAMLVRDYLAQGFYPDGTASNPGNASDIVSTVSGAAVKAILVASADWMDNSTLSVPTNNPGDNLAKKFRFNIEQGYGRIQLNNVLPLQTYNPTPSGLILADGGIVGGRNDLAPGLTGDINTGLSESDSATFDVCDDSRELRAALVYIDTPGDVLNVNLDLELRAPSGKIYYGNYFTDDNNRDGATATSEDCPNNHLTGSPTALDESPWSLEACANARRDSQNPSEGIFLSPDARNDTTTFNADKQTELGTWTILVRTGVPSTATTQRYAVVVTGGVCNGSSIHLDKTTYVCNQPVTVTVNEKNEAVDPLGSLTPGIVASRTTLEVYSVGADGVFGTADDVLTDLEDATSTGQFGFTQSGGKFTSGPITVTDSDGSPQFGDGALDVTSGSVIKATYRDRTSGVPDANKVRTSISTVDCRPAVSIGGVTFAQFGLDTSQAVSGGCEHDGRGLFTFGYPDRYLDAGERLVYQVAFQSSDSDLKDVSVSLRCVKADADSPASCQPGTTQCADPNRTNNAPCGSQVSILDSPKNIGDLPAGQIAAPSFTIQMGSTIPNNEEVDMLLGVSARKSGRTVEKLLATRNSLNSDELSLYYSTDFPGGGTEWADWPTTNTGQNPSNEVADGCLGFTGSVCVGGTHAGDPCTVAGDCPGGSCPAGNCPPPQSQGGDFNSDFRWDRTNWSALNANGRNAGITKWDFETGKQGYSVGLNNTTTKPLAETVANWGEDKNFDGQLNWYCSNLQTLACYNGNLALPNVGCGHCSLNPSQGCPVGHAEQCIGGGSCTADVALGTCISDEDRDPQNGTLDDNWSTLGGCGWQTNGTTNNPNLAGGVWHTGRIDIPAPPCLVSGNAIGACQGYEILTGTANVKREWEILRSPIFEKVNQCVGKCAGGPFIGSLCTPPSDPTICGAGTPTCSLPASCGGVSDTATTKVFTVEFMDWAWNMSMDLKDAWAQLRWEFDTDATKLTPVDLVNDAVVLNLLAGNQGPISGGNSPLSDGFQVFAPFNGSSSQNGVLGQNRVGRNPCYFETNPRVAPFHFADPWDDDLDNDGDGTVDEDVFPAGPLRNFDTAINDNPPADYRFNTLEDIYGPSGEQFQTALGFRVFEGDTGQGAAQTSFGVSVDDVVVQWREFKLTADASDCTNGTLRCSNTNAICTADSDCSGGGRCQNESNGECATVEVDTTRVFNGNGVLTITVTDSSPYRCLGGPPCVPEGKNDCNHDGDFSDLGDTNDCDGDGTPDVLVRAFSGAQAEPAGEWVVLNQVLGGVTYRGSLPISIGGNVNGVLYVIDQGGLNNDITVRYEDPWDGRINGGKCGNNSDPAKQGIVDNGVNLIVSDSENVVVTSFRIDDSTALAAANDADGYPDTNELVNLFVTVSNKTHHALTNLVVQVSVNDPKIECLLNSVATVANVAPDAVFEVPTPFQFKVAANADRTGAGKTVIDDYSASFLVTMSANEFEINSIPQTIPLDLDLNVTNVAGNTTTYTEGFEGGFGTFQFLNLDFNIATNAASNGMRCQFNDPDFVGSNSYGDTECYLGFIAGQSPINDWHVHTTASPEGGRAYLGTQSLHYGKHTPGNANLDTYGLSQLDAIRSKNAINMAARVCAALQGGQVKSCNSAADCTTPASACISASPLLSFKHQISTTDNRSTNTPDGQAADRGVVSAQLANSTIWQKLTPYQNVYDAQGTDNFSNCLFDPTDDGNNEDSYFDPNDPQRRLGPSSTCFPEFVFSYIGDTDPDNPGLIGLIGRASDGPGLKGSLGPGTWIETRFDLSRFRGRSVRLRYVMTSIKVSDFATLEALFTWNPTTADDGWYVDDIRLSQVLGSSSPSVSNDNDNHGNTTCGAICNTMTVPTLTASPTSLSSPGLSVQLTAASTVDRCLNGMLLYQFWLDVNNNSVIDSTIDTLLRDFSPNPVLLDSPTATTRYLVRVKCNTATAAPCNGQTGTTQVVVSSPVQSCFFPWARLVFNGPLTNKTVLGWCGGDPSGTEVIRGDLDTLNRWTCAGGASAGTPCWPTGPANFTAGDPTTCGAGTPACVLGTGNFNTTVLACVANDTTAATAVDATPVLVNKPFYFLARRSVPNTTWTPWPIPPKELPGSGGNRDIDLDGPPSKAANSCTSPP